MDELDEFDQEALHDESLFNLRLALSRGWDSSILHFIGRKGNLNSEQLEAMVSNIEELHDLLKPIVKNSYYDSDTMKLLADILDQLNQALEVSPYPTLGPLLKAKMLIEAKLDRVGYYYKKTAKEDYETPYKETPRTPREKYQYYLSQELSRLGIGAFETDEQVKEKAKQELLYSLIVRGRLPNPEDMEIRLPFDPRRIEKIAGDVLKDLETAKSSEILAENKGVIESRLWSYQPISEELRKFIKHQQEARPLVEHKLSVRRPAKTKLEKTAEMILQQERSKF
mgnify:CR=1 FL=1